MKVNKLINLQTLLAWLDWKWQLRPPYNLAFLERSCGLNLASGYGSIACLPIIETLSNDLSAYVATNVISITDGQLYLDTVLFGHGIFPAISSDKSVSRVGAKSLDYLWRLISFSLYTLINEYRQELESLIKSSLFKVRKHRFDRIHCLFQQRSSYYHGFNVYLVLSVLHGYCDTIVISFIRLFEYQTMYIDLNLLTKIDLIYSDPPSRHHLRVFESSSLRVFESSNHRVHFFVHLAAIA